MRHVYVAIPNHSGSLKGETSDSLLTAQAECYEQGWKFTAQRLTGGYHHLTRMAFVGQFLSGVKAHGYTDLVWWDDDVALAPGQFVKFVDHDVDFVCAPYRHKRDILSWPGEFPEPGKRKMHESKSTNSPLFNAVYWVIGLSRQTRKCVETIVAQPGVKWMDDDLRPGEKSPYLFGDEFMGDGSAENPWKLLTEDYVYCRRYIDAGGEVWVDPLMHTGHSGNKIWWGQLAADMQRQVEEHLIAQQLENAA